MVSQPHARPAQTDHRLHAECVTWWLINLHYRFEQAHKWSLYQFIALAKLPHTCSAGLRAQFIDLFKTYLISVREPTFQISFCIIARLKKLQMRACLRLESSLIFLIHNHFKIRWSLLLLQGTFEFWKADKYFLSRAHARRLCDN